MHTFESFFSAIAQHLKAKLDIDYTDENHTSGRFALCMEAVRRQLILP
jgi:hypothetical protein